jgi:protease II
VIVHMRGGGEMGRQWYEEPNGMGKFVQRDVGLPCTIQYLY